MGRGRRAGKEGVRDSNVDGTPPFHPTQAQIITIVGMLGLESIESIAARYRITVRQLREFLHDAKLVPLDSDSEWSEADDDILRSFWTRIAPGEIAARLGRSNYAVRIRAGELGIKQPRRRWSAKDDERLRSLYRRLPTDELARRLRRSTNAIHVRASYLGIITGTPEKLLWSDDEDARLRELYGTRPANEIARELGRSTYSVRARAEQFRLGRERWQPWEDELLVELYGSASVTKIAQRLNRTTEAVEARIGQKNMRGGSTRSWPFWDSSQDHKLVELFGTMPIDELADAVGLPRHRIRFHLRRLGLILKGIRPWTEDELTYLREAYPRISSIDVAAHLGRSRDAVKAKALRLGIPTCGERRPWTKREIEYMRTHFPKRSAHDIADHLGRSLNAVALCASRHGFRKKR